MHTQLLLCFSLLQVKYRCDAPIIQNKTVLLTLVFFFLVSGDTLLLLETPPCILDFRAHVCHRCCAEFVELSDLELHVRNCSPNQLVLVVSDNDDPMSSAEIFPLGSSPREPDYISEMEECSNLSEEKSDGNEDFMDVSQSKRSHNSLRSPGNTSSSESSSTDSTTNIDSHSSVLPTVLLQPGNNPSEQQGTFSWINSNVVIENLENTKVAVAQFSQQSQLDSQSSDSSKVAISSLMEQLLALQLQQIHQLQLIDQIRHQVLLFASQRPEVSEILTSTNCPQGNLASMQPSQLTTLSSHLSQQLAAAAGLAQSLASQSGSVVHLERLRATAQLPEMHLGSIVHSSTEPLQNLGKHIASAVSKQPYRKKYTHDSGPYSQVSISSQTKVSSSTTGTNSSLNPSNKSHLPHPPPSNQTLSRAGLNIGAVVEDLNALTMLAQQRKGKPPNVTSFHPKSCSDEAFLKHKCRFCAKVFGSDSALQIHLRSHTGERPYKCNICGNRFSTRGNLKVHFHRHKERYPHIQMNPNPVPEHLDNIPTSTGIPYGMSMPPEKPITCWLDSKPSLTTLTPSVGLLLPIGSPNLLIKKEEQPFSITASSPAVCEPSSAVKSSKSFDFVEAGKVPTFHILSLKTDNVKPHFTYASKISSVTEGSVDISADVPVINTNPIVSEQFRTKNHFGSDVFDSIQTSETSKLQQLVENIDKNVTDPNECAICHRVLSCQSALRMHYRTHTGERPFRCKVCGRAFSTKGNLKTHHAVHRATSPLRVQHSCPICQRKFTNAVVLQQHIRMHMGDQIPNTPISEKNYTMLVSERKLQELEKLSDFDDDRDFKDSGIAGMSTINNSLSGSLSQSPYTTGAGSYDAEMTTNCNWPVEERQVIGIKTTGLGKEYQQSYDSSLGFDISDGRFAVSENTAAKHSLSPSKIVSLHSSSRSLEERYQKALSQAHISPSPLQYIGSSMASLDHIKSLNPLKDPTNMVHTFREQRGIFKNTACDICGKTFACQSALDIHYRSHTKERPFICTACNRGFSTKGNLKQHMLTHQMRDLPSQLFEPSNPSLASSPNSSINPLGSQMIKTEVNSFLGSSPNGEPRDLLCSLGKTSAPSSSALAAPSPRRVPKQHYCHTCGKTFSSSSALQIHERTHTGEKPFACTVCGRAFTTKGNLKVHMGTHMWSSALTRRGRRLSVDGPLVFMGTHPVKLPEPPQRADIRSSNGESFCHWNHCAESFSQDLVKGTNDISVIQNGGRLYLSRPMGHGASSPIMDKLHHTEQNAALVHNGKNNAERVTRFCFTRLIEERKEMIAN
uniref:Sal-like protein 1 n=1 Tax=Esox lucius TaxID=8010 RepID=A0A3P9ABK7_ESOLU